MAAIAEKGVLYMLTGTAHAAQLAVSLRSLRRHWQGAVAIVAGCAESHELAVKIAGDAAAGSVVVVRWDAPRQRNAGYANKSELPRLSPFRRTVFLDADTLVVGDIKPVFPVDERQLVITQFYNWLSTGRKMRKRIEAWRGVAPVEVERMLAKDWPAINTGVIGFGREAPFTLRWRELCQRRLCFICDELAMQLLFPDFETAVLPSNFNASPTYCQESWRVPGDKSAVIWHGHGSRFVRDAGSGFGPRLWMPEYRAAIADNFGGLADWSPAGDKSLAEYLQKHGG